MQMEEFDSAPQRHVLLLGNIWLRVFVILYNYINKDYACKQYQFNRPDSIMKKM